MHAIEAPTPLRRLLITFGTAFSILLVWVGLEWPHIWTLGAGGAAESENANPFIQVLKLGIAAAIGVVVTAVHRPGRHHGKSSLPVEHAQILFCVAGALMMIIVGDSLARAFGAVGIASLVRFRTALKDPKEATILFLLIGLGMAVGRGIVATAGLGTLFVSGLLWALDHAKEDKPHDALLEVRFTGPDAEVTHVHDVLKRNRLSADPREIESGPEPVVRYHVVISGGVTPDDVNRQLMEGGGHGIRSVKWEMLKHKDG